MMNATYRPRAAAWVCGTFAVICTIACIALCMNLDGITLGDIVAFAGLDALVVWFLWRQASVYAKATDSGITVRNLFSTKAVTWEEVFRVRYGVDTAWARLELTTGEDLPVMAIQSADGERAAKAARELQTRLAEFDARSWTSEQNS